MQWVNNPCNSQNFLSLPYSSEKQNLFLRRKEWTSSTLQIEGKGFGAWAAKPTASRGREEREGTDRNLTSTIGQYSSRTFHLFSPTLQPHKDYYPHFTGGKKLGLGEVNTLLKCYKKSNASHILNLWVIRLRVHTPVDMKLTFLWINLMTCFI